MKARSLKALYPEPAKRFSRFWKNSQGCKESARDEEYSLQNCKYAASLLESDKILISRLNFFWSDV